VQRLITFALFILFLFYIFVIRNTSKNSLIYIPQDYNTNENNQNNNKKKVDLQNVGFDTKSIRFAPAETIMQNYNSMMIEQPDLIDWSKFAYAFYATSHDQLLPILINVKQLYKLKTKAKIEILCSFDYNLELPNSTENEYVKKIIKLLTEKYNVNLNIVNLIKSKFEKDSETWAESFTKLNIFNLVQFDRVLYLDSDAIIQKKMDQLFLLPPALLSIPLNYIDLKNKISFKKILDPEDLNNLNDDMLPTPFEYSLSIQDIYKKRIEYESDFNDKYFNSLYSLFPSIELTLDTFQDIKLASYFMLIIPDKNIFNWLLEKVKNKKPQEFDMEIINNVWKLSDIENNNYYLRKEISNLNDNSNMWLKSSIIPSLLILPHYPYGLLSGEFRHNLFEHSAYLSSPADLSYLNEKSTILSVQRSIKNGKNYKDIEDVLEVFPEVPYWDWAWRFNFEGKSVNIDELNQIIDDETLKSDNKNLDIENFQHIDKNDEIGIGMGVERFGWESKKIAQEACYIHWSDWPLDKPWLINDNNKWVLDKLAEESLDKCKANIKDVFESLLIDVKLKSQRYLEREYKFAERTCIESILTWKNLYDDYASFLNSIDNEITSI
jgi:alpha-N-acetylglucosamine transferase